MYKLRCTHFCVGDPSVCTTELDVGERGLRLTPVSRVRTEPLPRHELETQTWLPRGQEGIFVQVKRIQHILSSCLT